VNCSSVVIFRYVNVAQQAYFVSIAQPVTFGIGGGFEVGQAVLFVQVTGGQPFGIIASVSHHSYSYEGGQSKATQGQGQTLCLPAKGEEL
jgi:hypothetical protein